MNFNELLKQKANQLILDNKNDILKDNEKLMTKIRNNYDNYISILTDISFEDYYDKTIENIKNNNLDTLILYMKKITRQNIYEPIQISIMEKYLNIPFKRYNKESFKNTKSFDGINEDRKIILQCKYIKQPGGSQDNQFNDLIKFNIKQNNYENYLVISGEYGIKLMKEYIKNNKIHKHTHIILMDDDIKQINKGDIKQIDKNDIKKYNKYYSTNKELIHNINISPYLNNETLIIEPFYGDGDLLNMFEIDNKIIINDITEINPAMINDKLNIIKILNKDSLKKCLWKKYENDIFIITNPPYKAKNKLSKELKERYAKLLTNNINKQY